MSRTIKAMARLAQVRKDLAVAKSRRLAAEIRKNEGLRDQVLQFASEYGDQAVQAAQKGISVSQLRDTYAFRGRLLDGARDQQMGLANMARQLQIANLEALAATRKSDGFGRLIARKEGEAKKKLESSEQREVEDRVGAGRAKT